MRTATAARLLMWEIADGNQHIDDMREFSIPQEHKAKRRKIMREIGSVFNKYRDKNEQLAKIQLEFLGG